MSRSRLLVIISYSTTPNPDIGALVDLQPRLLGGHVGAEFFTYGKWHMLDPAKYSRSKGGWSKPTRKT